MPADRDGDLEMEDVVLRLEIGSHDANNSVKGGFGVCGEENGMRLQELRESSRRKGTFSGDVEDAARESSRSWQLRSEEKGEEEEGLASTTKDSQSLSFNRAML